jgi:hypothetical protein
MRKMFRFTWILAVAVCIYLGWIYYSRRSDNRAIIKRMEEKQSARDKAIVDAHGGGKLTILGFYSMPSKIRPGEKSQICYSVSNAESVRIEPPIENVWPSISRCVDVAPEKDTVYKLIAADAEGNTETAMTNVEVGP